MTACSSGCKKSVDSCQNVGLHTHDGRVMTAGPDPGAARQYYEKACIGAMYIEDSPGPSKDMGLAMRYATRACGLGHVWGCSNSSRMYKLGDGGGEG
ncbi:unnamed protein product [Coregonus sp. 'balchen']|nr:unnamed protein product [Coregonus sp. 'balchen']